MYLTLNLLITLAVQELIGTHEKSRLKWLVYIMPLMFIWVNRKEVEYYTFVTIVDLTLVYLASLSVIIAFNIVISMLYYLLKPL